MNVRNALGTGGLAGAACAACCAPPLIAALGLTVGLAAVAGVIVGIAAAIAVVILGAGYVANRRNKAARATCASPSDPVALAAPTRRPMP
jgi:nitrate/nitrite transporter NarK